MNKKQILLNEKHVKALTLLNEYNRLPSKDIADLGDFSDLRRCQEISKELAEAEPPYLKRVAFRPLNAVVGKQFYVYMLAPKGARLLSRELKYKVNTPKSPSASNLQLEHTLEVNNFRIILEKACDKHPFLRLIDCIPEYKGKMGDNKIPIRLTQETVKIKYKYAKPVTFIPDLIFALAKDDMKALFFVEIDLDSENPQRLEDKIRAYDAYFDNKGFKKYSLKYNYEFKGFRLLFVGSLDRFDSLLVNLYDTGIDLGFVWGCSRQELTADNFFDAIWIKGDRNRNERLSLVRSS
ncbi:MAG: hypothetical protein HOC71_02885 [Candidatus Latescibacteria bacterium]|jgi:hypothetical protein|nr:hypothetical protein [Candidatus Latescibacterota bacterium]